jgi:hypothetical protein
MAYEDRLQMMKQELSEKQQELEYVTSDVKEVELEEEIRELKHSINIVSNYESEQR